MVEPLFSTYLIAGMTAFLLGAIPNGVLISRLRYKIDVREIGSGNIGATNVTRVFGWGPGFLTLLLDVLKGYLPFVYVSSRYGHSDALVALVGALLVLGHCFSPYLKFKGGKGVATSLGVVLALNPLLGLGALIVYGILLGITRVSAIGSLGSLLGILIFSLVEGLHPAYQAMFMVIAVTVVYRHQSNLRRLFSKKPRLG